MSIVSSSLTRMFTYHMENPAQDREYNINCKRKVVQFVYRWVVTIRHPVFDDVVSMSFLEVFYIKKNLFSVRHNNVCTSIDIIFFNGY